MAYWRWANQLLASSGLHDPELRRKALQFGTTNPAALRVIGFLHEQRSYLWLRDRLIGARQAWKLVGAPGDSIDPIAPLGEIVVQLQQAGSQLLLVPEVEAKGGLVAPDYAQLMRVFTERYTHVRYYDPTEQLSDPACFIDVVHLTPVGTEKLAQALAPVVRSWAEQGRPEI